MYLKKVLILIQLIFVVIILSGQSNYQPILNIPVTKNGSSLINPWAGGLNTPQFYSMEINGDGAEDLFVFDRSGNKVLVFLYKNNSYQYTTAYDHIFPSLQHWVVVEDFNCDNIPDLYTANNTFIRLFKGHRSGNDLSFTLQEDTLKYQDDQSLRPINILQIDIPAVIDVNNDGDKDILTFSPGGGYMYYFENTSQEQNNNCGLQPFQLADECWGEFYESGLTKFVDLDSCGTGRNINGGNGSTQRHAGSTVLAFDINGDGVKEVLLGDISFNNLNLLINGGTLADAKIVNQNINFPDNTTPVDLPIFPAAFYLDINKDGKKDLLVSPNAINNSVDVQNVWYYQNNGTTSNPSFQFVQQDFLVEEMIDVGTASAPTFFDYNRDGLQDIIIGNESKQIGTNEMAARLVLYLNNGTVAEPAYELADTNIFNIAQFNLFGIHPAFGDMDGDGDDDMIIGDFDGKLHYFENKSATGASFPSINPNYFNIDVGSFATPQIVDVNRDGLPDLLIGERNGNLNYYQNTGTAASPQFSATATNDFFGKVDVRPQFSPVGFSVPYLFEPETGQNYKLLVGNLAGKVILYENIEGNLTGIFQKVDSTFFDMDFGERAAVSGKDLNNDQKPEILVGNMRGGVTFFSRDIAAGKIATAGGKVDFDIFPVPADDILNINFQNKIYGNCHLYIYDLTGKRYLYNSFNSGELHTANISQLSGGMYIAVLEIDGHRISRVFIIQR